MTEWAAGHDLPTGADFASAAEAWADLFGETFTPRIPELNPVGSLPIVTPETWPGVKGACKPCKGCDVCSWFRVLSAIVAADDHRDGRKITAEATKTEDAPRWRSVEQALKTFSTSSGRLSAKSGLGSHLEGLRDLGVQVQRQGHRSRHGSRSDDYVEVEKALRVALTPERREGLSLEDAVQVVLVRAVGVDRRQPEPNAYGRAWSKIEKAPLEEVAAHFEISTKAVTRLVRRGMHGLRVELGSRGLTPMPKRGTRANIEALGRREVLGGG